MDPLRIIIADDHPLFREGLEQALLRLMPSATIYLVSDGEQVLEMLKSKFVELIFLDIRMPGRDGIEITRAIRKGNDQVKIIAVTMINDRATVMKIFEAGANGYLHKNTEKCALQRVIEVVFSGGTYISDEVVDYKPEQPTTSRVNDSFTAAHNILSEREIEILILICNQYSSREIANKLCVNEKTVETHRNHLMWKTQSKNVVGLTMYAISKGYYLPEHRQ